ncbi:MAG: T9SS type A sorting domain-containing protein [Bacteroidales bacterium]|jgi:DNA-binding beta-propeller fold protein YncE|nr:T9SS type A sorting domain-containing protein [Bacteroidales bacterium]
MKTIINIFFKVLLFGILILLISKTNFSQTFQDTIDYPWQYIGNHYSISDTTIDLPVNYPSGNELLTQTLWIPGVPGGIIPYDIVYVGNNVNKIFVYGNRKIIVLDGATNGILHEISLSEYGSQSLVKYEGLYNTKEKHLAWNPDQNLIYCVDDNLDLYIINPTTYSITQLPHQINGFSSYDYTILKYNDLTNQLYWLVTKESIDYSKLLIFSTENQTITKINELIFNQPFDIEFHPQNPLFYISDDNYLYIYSCNNFEEQNSYSMEMKAGEIIVAYSNGFNTDKVYCLPNNKYLNPSGDPYVLVLNGTIPTEISVDHYYYTAGCYNPNNNIVFFGYSHLSPNGAGVTLYRANSENTFLADHEFSGNYFFDQITDFTYIGNKTIGCSEDQIFFYNNNFFLTDYTFTENKNAYYYRLCNNGVSKVFVTNLQGGKIDIFSTTTYNLLASVLIGNASYHGFIDNNTNKLFTYNCHDLGNHEMICCDLSDNSIEVFDIGYMPTGIAHDYVNSKIYITNYNSTQLKIKVFDCNSNEFNDDIIINGYNKCNELFWAPENKLYLSVESGWNNPIPKILIYDLNSNALVTSILGYYTTNTTGHDTHFLYDETNNRIFVSIKEWLLIGEPPHGSIIIINNDTYSFTRIDNIFNGDKLRYNAKDNILIIKQFNTPTPLVFYDAIYLVNVQDLSYISVPVRIGKSIVDIEYDSYRNNIYCTFEDNSGNIYKLNGETGALQKIIYTTGITNSLLYNPVNRNIYAHMILDYASNRKLNEELLIYNPDQDNISIAYLGQKEGPRNYLHTYITDIIHDSVNNYIYHTNSQSNICVLKCSNDQLTLQPRTWNWISFPRLVREGNGEVYAMELLENIAPFPTTGQMTRWVPINQGTQSIVWNEHVYTGELINVQSTLGYKLETSNHEVAILPMTGTVLAPETMMPLFADGLAIKTNWTGYYLPVIQSPFDAIGEEFLEDMNMLKGKYWSCIKKDPGHTKTTGGIWACACQQGRVEIKYGEMIEIYPTEDIPLFHWQMDWMQQESEPKPPSLLFQYEEKAEYDALFIELDTLNLPEEIGAFAGDSCIGATTVLPTDTMALICAYTEGFEGEEITFELLFPTKSARPRCRDYSVLNTTTGIREKRRIVAGENQPYFLVSLKSQENIPAEAMTFNLSVRPNPASNEFTVSYFTGEEALIELSLINALGLTVNSLQRGVQNAGSYSMTINTSGLPSGCYYLKVKASNAVEIQKIMIIH